MCECHIELSNELFQLIDYQLDSTPFSYVCPFESHKFLLRVKHFTFLDNELRLIHISIRSECLRALMNCFIVLHEHLIMVIWRISVLVHQLLFSVLIQGRIHFNFGLESLIGLFLWLMQEEWVIPEWSQESCSILLTIRAFHWLNWLLWLSIFQGLLELAFLLGHWDISWFLE